MAEISIRRLNKIYDGKVHAVHDLNLEIGAKDFVVLVGPSGCGKSTILRMIAGLEEISFGELFFDGELVNEVSAKDRNVAMVFQNYALFPHLTVYDNIAFRLRMSKVPRAEIKERVNAAAEILGITQLLTRKPAQLSGGQKQRVALGRAIVCRPRVFLLDEPLSNLDAKLRASMRSELIRLHDKLQTTFIYVTHDQTEALTMGTKIAVLKDGYLQQAASPTQIYDYPDNLFVATFMGSPQMNLFNVTLEENGTVVFKNGDKIALPKAVFSRIRAHAGKELILGIRPEQLIPSEKGEIQAVTDFVELLGNSSILQLVVEGARNQTSALLGGRDKTEGNVAMRFTSDMAYAQFFDPKTERSLLAPPDCNRIPLSIAVEGEQLAISFGKYRVVTQLYENLLDSALNEENLVLTLPATQPTMKEGDLIPVPVTISSVFPRYDDEVVYAQIEGVEAPFVFKAEKGTYQAGQTQTLLYAPSELGIENADGERLLTAYPTRGRIRKVAKRGKKMPILADECLGKQHVLYCGTKENYCAVLVGEDFPVYFKEMIRVEEEVGTAR